ncbi:MAG: hypothetical protein P8Y15_15370 [Gemmatimonadales bacterium]
MRPVHGDRVWREATLGKLVLVVLNDQNPAVSYPVQQRRVSRHEVRPHLVGAYAEDNDVEALQLVRLERTRLDHLDRQPELADRLGHLIARACYVPDPPAGVDLDIDAPQSGPGSAHVGRRLDVRIVDEDGLLSVRATARLDYRAQPPG